MTTTNTKMKTKTKTKTQAWGTGVALASLVLLAGCAGASSGASDGSFGEISGSPVSLETELTALCAEIVEQALPVDVALVLAESNGYVASVVGDSTSAPAGGSDVETGMVFTTSGDIVVGCEAQG